MGPRPFDFDRVKQSLAARKYGADRVYRACKGLVRGKAFILRSAELGGQVSAPSYREEAQQCRRQAERLAGRPEEVLLLTIARTFEQLEIAEQTRRIARQNAVGDNPSSLPVLGQASLLGGDRGRRAGDPLLRGRCRLPSLRALSRP
jgi:hypothetical protein